MKVNVEVTSTTTVTVVVRPDEGEWPDGPPVMRSWSAWQYRPLTVTVTSETAMQAGPADIGRARLRLHQIDRRLAELGGRPAKDGKLASMLSDLSDIIEHELSEVPGVR